MEFDLKEISADLAEISADVLLKKDISKHKEKIYHNINLIEKIMSEYGQGNGVKPNQKILQIAYWFYEARDLYERATQPKQSYLKTVYKKLFR